MKFSPRLKMLQLEIESLGDRHHSVDARFAPLIRHALDAERRRHGRNR